MEILPQMHHLVWWKKTPSGSIRTTVDWLTLFRFQWLIKIQTQSFRNPYYKPTIVEKQMQLNKALRSVGWLSPIKE